ncbi:MAG: hypothetical protein AABW81_03060 [Nanoarchaeota archaeon]
MQEKENILRILKETKDAVKIEDNVKLKRLSDQTIHTASITQDPDNIAIAVIVYSVSKIIERKKYQEYPGWNKFYKVFVSSISNSINSIERNDNDGLKKNIEIIRKEINTVSGRIRKYIQDVFRRASINKASRIYEHGISMEKTSKLLGITLFELASYAGQTGISDAPLGRTLDPRSRIKLAMEMFG